MTDEELMWISAVRYALGRRTYIVSVTCDFVKQHLKRLSKQCVAIMLDSIRSAHDLGDDCDKARWYDLLDELKNL